MIDGSEKLNRQLAFEFHNSPVLKSTVKLLIKMSLNFFLTEVHSKKNIIPILDRDYH